ncbi:MAG TPA: hypothetical protein VF462_12085 [Micromonosporaceae bacterium]
MVQTVPEVGVPGRPPEARKAADARPLVRLAAMGATVVATAAMLAFSVRGGMPAMHALQATVAVLVTQILPGAVAWRAVRPRHGWVLEDVAMGFAIGSALAIGAQVVAGLAEQPWLAFGPLAVAVVLLLVPVTRARIRSAETRPLPWWWGPSVAGLFLIPIFQLPWYFRSVPLHWEAGARAPHVDAYDHLALAAQLAHRGPTTFPYVESEPLAYHWFSHAWVAQVSGASGAGLDEVLFRFMPALMPVVVVLAVATAAVRLTNRPWAGPVAGALAMAGGDLNVLGKPAVALPIAPLSPSLGLAAPMMVGIVSVLALRWNRSMHPAGVVLLPVLCMGAAGTKGSTVPLVVAGLGLALVAMLVFDRSRIRHVILDLLIVLSCLALAIIVVFHGTGSGLQLDPWDAAQQTFVGLGTPDTGGKVVLVLAVAVVGILARGTGALVLPFSRTARRSPLPWFLGGAGLAGAGAVALFTHPGAGQWYFARTAIPLLALGSAVGLVALVAAIRPSRLVRLVALAALTGPAMVWLGPAIAGPLVRGGWARALGMIAIAVLVVVAAGLIGLLAGRSPAERFRLAGAAMVLTILAGGAIATAWELPKRPPDTPAPTVPLDRAGATSRGQVDAARWIRDHSDVNDLVMTNRHCTTPAEPANCESRRFVVAAFSERQVLLEGWAYTPMSAKLGPHGRDSLTVSYWQPDLLRLNDGFIAEPTAEAARELQNRGVRWIFVDHTRPYAKTLEPYAKLRYQAPGVDVYEFPAPAS